MLLCYMRKLLIFTIVSTVLLICLTYQARYELKQFAGNSAAALYAFKDSFVGMCYLHIKHRP